MSDIKAFTIADLVSWLKSNVVDVDYFTIRMEQLGYADLDIKLYIQAVGKGA